VKRILPVVIAIVVLAGIGGGLWLANRDAPIPSATPATAPAVGSCWDVDAATLTRPLPWPGHAVACTAPHTAEVFYTGQVDHSLIKDYRSAKGQAVTAASVLLAAEARSGCSGRATAYLGGAWRSAQLTVVTPEKDGFYACAVAQVRDPGGTTVVRRTSALAGSGVRDLGIDCYAGTGDLSFVPCTAPHAGEYVGLYTVTPLGAAYNGPELQSAVTAGCQQILAGFLGLSAGATARTDLRSSYVGPTSESTWLGSDQSFACYASAGSTLTASVKGLGTRPLPH
jgi:hypothetical protein